MDVKVDCGNSYLAGKVRKIALEGDYDSVEELKHLIASETPLTPNQVTIKTCRVFGNLKVTITIR